MKIELKQSDIEQAIKLYLVSAYGISMTGKDFEATFKAGRKGSGVSVNVVIADSKQQTEMVEAVVESITEVNISAAKIREAELVSELIHKIQADPVTIDTTDTPAEEEESDVALSGASGVEDNDSGRNPVTGNTPDPVQAVQAQAQPTLPTPGEIAFPQAVGGTAEEGSKLFPSMTLPEQVAVAPRKQPSVSLFG